MHARTPERGHEGLTSLVFPTYNATSFLERTWQEVDWYLFHLEAEDDLLDLLFVCRQRNKRVGVVWRHRFLRPGFARKFELAKDTSFHLGGYGSGLLYSIAIAGEDTNYIAGGLFTGLTFVGLLDVNVGGGVLQDLAQTDQPIGWQLNASVDIPLHEYLDALQKK